MTVIRRYILASAVDPAAMQKCIAIGALAGPIASSPGQAADVPLNEGVAGYAETADEYMGMLGYTFVAQDPAVALGEAGIAVTPLLDTVAVDDHGDVDGAVTLDMGTSLNHKMTLTGDLGTDDITVTLPKGPRTMTVEVEQGGVGEFTIAADAWTDVDWGTTGAPVFGGATGESVMVVIWSNGVKRLGFASTNVFG